MGILGNECRCHGRACRLIWQRICQTCAREVLSYLHKKWRSQRALQEVLVGESLEVDSITAANNGFMVMEHIPGEAHTRTKVHIGPAGSRAAISDSGSADYARQEAVCREEERIRTWDRRRIKGGSA